MKQFIKKVMNIFVVLSALSLAMNAHVLFSLFLKGGSSVSMFNAIRGLMLSHSPFILSMVGIIAAVQSGSETIRKISELSKKGRDKNHEDAAKKGAIEDSSKVVEEDKNSSVNDANESHSESIKTVELTPISEASSEKEDRNYVTEEASQEQSVMDKNAVKKNAADRSEVVKKGDDHTVSDIDDSQFDVLKKMVGVAPKVEFNMIGGDVLSAFEVVRLGVVQGWHATVRYGIPSLGRFGRSSAIGIRNECAAALKKLSESAKHARSADTNIIHTKDFQVSDLEVGINTPDKTSGITAVGFFPSLRQYAQRQFYVGAGLAQQPSGVWWSQLNANKSDLQADMLEEGMRSDDAIIHLEV